MSLLQTYLSELYSVRATGAGVKETSYYPAVSNVFNALGKTLKPPVRCIINLKNQGAGLPDGGLFTPDQFAKAQETSVLPLLLPSRGVMEVKGTGEEVAQIAASAQVQKYWAKYGQVLVTNLRDFALVGKDAGGQKATLERFSLAPNEAVFWALAANPGAAPDGLAERFAEYLKRVLLHAAPLATPQDVAWFLASYARDAKSRIGAGDLPALESVRGALEEALGLTFQGEKGEHFFRSTLVQTLFYGVFSAWVLWSRLPEAQEPHARFSWKEAAYYLHVPMIQTLFEEVSKASHLHALGLVEVLDWTGATLNRVDRAAFFAHFDQGHAVQYFYEPFLQAFDPELRKDLGVWYTPPEIVQYMVARVDTALREELGLADGLADPNVYVLDPCCGTGAYLVEVLNTIQKTLDAQGGDALGGSDLKRAAMERVFGFEILPAPYVVAHLQLGLLLQNAGAPLAPAAGGRAAERAGVFLTNALTGWEPPTEKVKQQLDQLALAFPDLKKEYDAAEVVKHSRKILVVLGNPPYNAFAGTSPAEEQGLVESYKAGLISEWGIKKFNLDDLYVRFFRLAERCITEGAGRGVVCYISNFSYLSDPSFVSMRQRFLSGFDALWFDCLNGDSRETGKTTPEGKPDPSVFSTDFNREGIRVGTAIGLMVRRGHRASESSVHFRQFWGTAKRADLLESLHTPDVNTHYLPAAPTKANRFSFRPSDIGAHYEAWPALVDLCNETPISGLQEMRRGALMHVSSEALSERIKTYFDTTLSWEAFQTLGVGLAQDGGRFDAKATRAKVQNIEQFNVSRIRRYALYPLDLRWCYHSNTRPLWNEPRPALASQGWPGNKFLVTRMVAERPNENVPIMMTSALPDYHLLRPNAVAIPLQLRTSLLGQTETPTANLSKAARTYLAALGLTDPDADADTAALLWMHTLAIGYSPAYLTENADGIRADWPRIPLPADAERLRASAALGRQVAALLDTETPVPGVTVGPLRPELKTLGPIARVGGGTLDPAAGDLRVTAGWGHGGQGGVTMPGKGKSVTRDYTPDEAAALNTGARACLGETTRDIFLNETAYWKNVPARVWDYTIGGYQVMKKWLSYRERSLLGRDLTPDEAREVTQTVRRLAALRLLEPSLDANYEAVKVAAYSWPGTPAEG